MKWRPNWWLGFRPQTRWFVDPLEECCILLGNWLLQCMPQWSIAEQSMAFLPWKDKSSCLRFQPWSSYNLYTGPQSKTTFSHVCWDFSPWRPKLPMTHSLRHSSPSSLSCAWSWPSTFCSEGCIQPLKLPTAHQPEKWEQFSGPLCFGCHLLQPRTKHVQIHIR